MQHAMVIDHKRKPLQTVWGSDTQEKDQHPPKQRRALNIP